MRTAELSRKTGETQIVLALNLDDETTIDIQTGVPFFDHMLHLFAKHGRFGLIVKAEGDIEVDAHHTVEDIGIVLGQCLKDALGDKSQIVRYGTQFVPMDEALGQVSIDLSGRSYLVFDANFSNPKLGLFDTELVLEFFQAVTFNAEMNCHVKVLYGTNTHHKIEALFKAFGRALREAVTIDTSINGVNSTKGSLL
ncbi:imidazoleglycerol-phosphate dehydratase HisB [Brochothrix thermosphacta]|uniref:Imidazoleglycerol-phosphate dehydratase n=1 Tax=Brochothrix thermosphacta TaxID=2756 RepID=A0A1D2K402_BROTH|nr:imidazoleglycerol-phosphate dehydratase HisB [Brochothrix thermosphacta]SLM90598.1 Imidazoleglycerol-phosphate dehydratase [Brachybacterium faecium]ATF24899.1 imidazoleglycerol-phosphate dehydratase [Brochothrix thermosphacta]ATH84314.1 imidazoleglycerol-phosphate dehydratase [Brochothrix thermosphacta]EUJ37791.1 imidazoleglycerol-phosphate dehydratase [Brochothrix thermosphacta DSM 20171 = FSL F6-1036]MPQ28397.1 imidazoleglycerol-phosphate dehydratase HisB [Brochothrix thermosphacta]